MGIGRQIVIVIQLLILFGNRIGHLHWVGTVSVHMFTFGVMGLIIPAMLIRISRGHTGRKVIFDNMDKFVLRVMVLGLLVRVVLPQLYPASYTQWIYLAAACWLTCFTVPGWRYIPLLLAPRWMGARIRKRHPACACCHVFNAGRKWEPSPDYPPP